MKVPRPPDLARHMAGLRTGIDGLTTPNLTDRGTATLVSGQVYVTVPLATASSIVMVTYAAAAGTPGILEVVPSAGQIHILSITSARALNTADTSQVYWIIL